MKKSSAILLLMSAVLSTGCSQSSAVATPPIAPSVESCEAVQEYSSMPATKPTNFKVAESSADGLFIRVSTEGTATIAQAKEIINAYANDYDRIDICEPGHTERGEECMSYSDGVLVDYRTGKSIPIEI